MPEQQQMTLEQLEAHLKKGNIEQFATNGGATAQTDAAAAAPADVLKKICGAYKVIKPILTIVLNFPLIPSSVKNAIRTFMNIMNGICA